MGIIIEGVLAFMGLVIIVEILALYGVRYLYRLGLIWNP